MEENVPHASNPSSGATSRHQAQHRNTAPITTDSTSINITSTASATADVHDDNIDSDDDETRRRHNTNQRSATSRLANLPLLLSKCILLITVLLRILFYPVRRLSKVFFPPGEFDDVKLKSSCDKAARAFVEYFQSTFLSNLAEPTANNESSGSIRNDDNAAIMARTNPFSDLGYSTILANVSAQTLQFENSQNGDSQETTILVEPPPLVLIYLHSPMHREVSSFLSNTLCNPQIMTWMNENVHQGNLRCWGASIHTAEGASVQSTFGASAFPFLAIVRVQKMSPPSSRQPGDPPATPRVELQLSISGPTLLSITPRALQLYLSTVLQHHTATVAEQTARRLQRAQEVLLRREQDREYRDALEADQRKERDKAERDREERRIEEDAEEAKREAERKEAKRVGGAREMLESGGSEPQKGEVGCVRVRFMLPNGSRVERRFRGSDKVGMLKAFIITYLDEHKDIGIRNFELSSNYPKKVLVRENTNDFDAALEATGTMQEEGLCPQAVVMLQDLDA